jgi:hypothetical protein
MKLVFTIKKKLGEAGLDDSDQASSSPTSKISQIKLQIKKVERPHSPNPQDS